jgi:hypothetical protein
MKAMKILIGTTDGPTEVQRITPEDPEVRSVVCLDGKAIALPISEDYDAFVRRPTGVIEALTGHSAYRVDISQPIGCGYSWQLGILAAHMLAARGRLAGAQDTPQAALWLTGEVDHHFSIGTVEDVALKLMRATSALKALIGAGQRVTVVVPEACGVEAAKALADAFPGGQAAPRLVAARHLDDVLPLLGLPRLRRRFPGARMALGRVRRTGRMLATGAAVLGGVFLLALAWSQGGPTDPAVARNAAVPATPVAKATASTATEADGKDQRLVASPAGAPPSVSLIETRAPVGQGCAAVAFQRAKPVISRHRFASTAATSEGPARPVPAAGLCDLRHRIVNTGLGRLEIAVVAARFEPSGARFRTRPLAIARTLDPGETLDLDARPPRTVPEPLVQRLAVLALPGSWPRSADRLKQAVGALRDAGSAESWARVIDTLAGQAVFLTTGGEIFTPHTGGAGKIGQTLP